MTGALQAYRTLSARLFAVRESHGGEESDEEDAVLDEMDAAWWKLTVEERASVESDGRSLAGT